MNVALTPCTVVRNKNNHFSSYSPAFTSNCQTIGRCRPNFTYFFRDDFDWSGFAKYLNKHFAGADKVNIYNAACSDGTEPFTLVMSLLRKVGREKSEKFLPVEAFDINDKLITDARSGKIPLMPGIYGIVDMLMLKFGTMFGEKKFLNYCRQDNGRRAVKIKDDVRRLVEFNTADVIKRLDTVKSENTVFLCRNMWMYLNENEQTKLASKLGKKLAKNSVVVIGEYDKNVSFANLLLEKNGFEETYIDKVYEKMV